MGLGLLGVESLSGMEPGAGDRLPVGSDDGDGPPPVEVRMITGIVLDRFAEVLSSDDSSPPS